VIEAEPKSKANRNHFATTALILQANGSDFVVGSLINFPEHN
jgi:hypothetical protein